MKYCALLVISIVAGTPFICCADAGPWKMHVIDDSSRGADGVRLRDVNADGLMDITTGWEEGGVVRAYLNPGSAKAKEHWPAVTVGRVKSAEDAVFVDLDGDGSVDVVSSCEGKTRKMYVHWAPRDRKQYLNEKAWKTEAIPATNGYLWMFALPMQIDGRNGVDLIVSSKGNNATIGWLVSPEHARDVDKWTYHQIYRAGWIMTLRPIDMDGDGDQDVLASDRKGAKRGVLWLENPGSVANARHSAWKEHRIGAANREVMFLDSADVNGDARMDVLVAVKKTDVILLLNPGDPEKAWTSHTVSVPPGKIGTSKSVRAGDIDLDGKLDIVVSCEHANGSKEGMFWLGYEKSIMEERWQYHSLGGGRGVKYDRIELIDLDSDGDLDAICCEERDQLGVFWYENPTR